MNERLQTALKKLRLSGLAESLDVRVQEAASHKLTHEEFLELILQDELAVRHDRLIARRIKAAEFRELKPLDDFDFSFNPKIDKKRIFDLATCRFIRQTEDVLWLGPPGVGKSFLVQAIKYQAIQAGYVVYYRSIFDVVRDFMQDLFEIIMRRYELRSTMMTSNRPIDDWGKLLRDLPAATAILDRFLHHAQVIEMNGKSYRMKDRGQPKTKSTTKKPGKPANGSSECKS